MAKISLAKRPYDIIFVLYFFLTSFICVTIDVKFGLKVPMGKEARLLRPPCNHSNPILNYGCQLDHTLLESLDWYADDVDPLSKENPLWFQLMAFFHFLCFPVVLLIGISFLFGFDWIRTIALVYCSYVSFTMYIVFGEEYYGKFPVKDSFTFLSSNVPYLLVPLLCILRLSFSNTPFSVPDVEKVKRK